MVTENWETLTEIQKRTGLPADKVVESVKRAFNKGTVVCQFVDRDTKKVVEWKKIF